MKPLAKTEAFMNSPGRFFHYEILSTSSFRKNLIIPEAAMLSKIGKKIREKNKKN